MLSEEVYESVCVSRWFVLSFTVENNDAIELLYIIVGDYGG